jgi:hypothetical protein
LPVEEIGGFGRLWEWVKSWRLWRSPPIVWIPYLPLVAIYAALLLVIMGFGGEVGAPSLIWHDILYTQFLSGVAVCLLCVQLCFVGYVLDSSENPAILSSVGTVGGLARYSRLPFAGLIGALCVGAYLQTHARLHGVLVLVVPLIVFRELVRVSHDSRSSLPLIALIPSKRHAGIRALVDKAWPRLPRSDARRGPEREAHVVQVAASIYLTLFYGVFYVVLIVQKFVPIVLPLPAALSVCFALSLFVALWGFLRAWYRRYRLVAGLVALLVLAVTGTDPRFGLRHVVLQPPSSKQQRGLLDDAAALKSWKDALAPESKPPLVVVATSGGALRAAIWTISVLGALEGRIPGFMRHVRVITGASGGMVGAAHLVSALEARGTSSAPLDPKWFDGVMEDAARDSLTPVAHALIFPFEDRGRALERSWELNTNGRMAMPFRSLARGETSGWLPSLIYSPMMVEDGRRLLVSNLDLADLTASFPPAPAISSVQLFACAGEGIDEIRLSTVARLSATFPWVTSAGRLDSDPDRRVVDAGYYDNYGVDLAASWIRRYAGRLTEKKTSDVSGVLLIQIRDEKTYEGSVDAVPGPTYPNRLVSPLTTPIEALLSARDASMLFRNESEVAGLGAYFPPELRAHGNQFFATATFECPYDVPLEWYLNRWTIDRLKEPPPPPELEAVAAWWSSRPSDR